MTHPGGPLRIVVGMSGGIAAYKAVGLIRDLVLEGHEVHAVPTASALRFIGKPTLEAISRNPVTDEVFDGVAEVRHVALGQQADVIAIVPATANTIAKLASGLADDLLGTTVLASSAPLVVAPAMHTGMWEHAATQANVTVLRERGVIIVGPESGQLTGDDSGPGRLANLAEVRTAITEAARGNVTHLPLSSEQSTQRDYAGRRVLVTAGGTREPLDPVRFLGNRSSGRQGIAIADRARLRGADVTLIGANLEVDAPDGLRVIPVTSAEELHRACMAELPGHDLIVMAAAVADYRPVSVSETKIAKEDAGDQLTVTLERTPDILRGLVASASSEQIIVGFAAETEPDDERLLDRARAKLQRKGCDVLVVNRVGWELGFQRDENEVVVLARDGEIIQRAAGSKMSVADAILDSVR